MFFFFLVVFIFFPSHSRYFLPQTPWSITEALAKEIVKFRTPTQALLFSLTYATLGQDGKSAPESCLPSRWERILCCRCIHSRYSIIKFWSKNWALILYQVAASYSLFPPPGLQVMPSIWPMSICPLPPYTMLDIVSLWSPHLVPHYSFDSVT